MRMNPQDLQIEVEAHHNDILRLEARAADAGDQVSALRQEVRILLEAVAVMEKLVQQLAINQLDHGRRLDKLSDQVELSGKVAE